MSTALTPELCCIAAIKAALATQEMEEDVTSSENFRGETCRQGRDDDVLIDAEARTLEADTRKVNLEPSNAEEKPDDIEILPSDPRRQQVEDELSPLITTPSPPPQQYSPVTTLPAATCSQQPHISHNDEASGGSYRPGKRRAPKLKDLLRPKSQKEIDSWKTLPWCRDRPTSTYAVAIQDYHKAAGRASRERKKLKKLGLSYEHISVPRFQEILASRGLGSIPGSEQKARADDDIAFAQAYRDYRNAQARASQERSRLRKAGIPCDHVVAPSLAQILASRGIKDPRKKSSQRDNNVGSNSSRAHGQGRSSSQDDNNDYANNHDLDHDEAKSNAPSTCSPEEDELEDDSDSDTDSDCSKTLSISLTEMRSSGLPNVQSDFERNKEMLFRLAGMGEDDLTTRRSDIEEPGNRRKGTTSDTERDIKRQRCDSCETDHVSGSATQDDTGFAAHTNPQHTFHCDLTLRPLLPLPPTPTPSTSSLPPPSGTERWPSRYIPSASPLPTPSASLAPSVRHAMLNDAVTLACIIDSINSRLGEAQKCFDRLQASLAGTGMVESTHLSEWKAEYKVAMTQTESCVDG
ncbi:hypothetical protein EX895_002400 [Sporisorium graminicola]|uniref:Uncharacterized protein n=1 Tax=Sporisorium graminicola TaxID=280036 RepID=A0A4V6YEP7_9BASI|nr:hypothetical protein EX895_002400 [Sporisorium graminicola]TKY88769.1 hypothetical protein EX895_002400 [Sporisorium graminicola]